MSGFFIFLFFIACVFAFVIPLSIMGFKRQKNLLKILSDKFKLKRINDNEIKGVIDNQIVHGYFKKEKTSDDSENTYFYLNVRPKNKKNYNISASKPDINFFLFNKRNKSNFITGDDSFDELVSLKGNYEKDAFSKLSYRTRILIKKHVDEYYGLKIYNDFMILKNSSFDSILLSDALKAMIYISKRLSSTKPTDELLKENISSIYELDEVRIKNMEYLLESPELQNYNDFFKSLSDDHLKEIQIMAAYGLKEKGLSRLLDLLKNADDKLKHFSVKYAADFFNHDSVREYIYTFLNSGYTDLIIKTINILTKKKDIKSINIVANFIKTRAQIIDSSIAVKLSLIEYTSKLKIKKNFKWLVSLLKDHKNDILIPVINALKKLNNIKAVEYLLPLTKNIFNSEIKKSAQDAINILQKNIPDSNRGTLTMMEESASGELSIEDNNDAGNLSLE